MHNESCVYTCIPVHMIFMLHVHVTVPVTFMYIIHMYVYCEKNWRRIWYMYMSCVHVCYMWVHVCMYNVCAHMYYYSTAVVLECGTHATCTGSKKCSWFVSFVHVPRHVCNTCPQVLICDPGSFVHNVWCATQHFLLICHHPILMMQYFNTFVYLFIFLAFGSFELLIGHCV